MKKRKFSPVYVFIMLTFATMFLSFVLSTMGVQAEYSTISSYTNSLQNNVVQVENMLSSEGLKYIVTNAVNSFVNFEPLAMLIIVLIGIGVIEKTGFARVFFTLITQNFRKNSITFILVLLSIIASLFGNTGFVVFLPLGALLFKYGRRHPLGGIIASFAGICFGYSINIFLSSVDTSLISLTTNAAHLIDSSYSINTFFELAIMSVATVAAAIIISRITEKVVMPKLGKYEFEEIEVLSPKLTNRELRGLIVSIASALVYILIIVYMILPGLPLSGGLLDNNATYYIDKLFGENSLFAQGFVFIIMFLFIIIGIVYGLVSKTIKTNKDISESLSFSLDGIGSIIVLLFAASLFISVFEKSNIGILLVSALTNLIDSLHFSGIGLVAILLVVSIILGLVYPSLISKWQIMSPTVVPLFMKSSLSAEFAQVIYVAGSSLSMAFTPLMAYYVIYIAFFEKYNKEDATVFGSFKYMKYYGFAILIMWVILLLGFYVTGLPIGVGTSSMLKF